MPEISAKPVRVIKREERDEDRELAKQSFATEASMWATYDALERKLKRVLDDVQERKQAHLVGKTPPQRKTRESIPALVNLVFICFPATYEEQQEA